MHTLDGRYAIVTGAGTGIGRAIAIRYAAEGACVALVGRRRVKLEDTLGMLPRLASGEAGDHLVVPADVGDEHAIDEIAGVVRDYWGRVDVLVSNAGLWKATDPVTSQWADWFEPMRVILLGAAHLVRAFAPMMPEGGRVIAVTSVHADRVERGGSSYAAAKGGLTQYVRSLALELAPRNILVNAIAPGFVDTPMSMTAEGVNELESEWFRSHYVEGHHLPLKRAGRPEEIAGVAAFLAGPDATYITGQTIVADGGLTITF